MPPLIRPALFKQNKPLIAVSPDEPCLALIRNDVVFNLLIADVCFQQEQHLVLDRVWWFSVRDEQRRFEALASIYLMENPSGIWRAWDPTRGKFLRQPSRIPYHVVFIDVQEQARLRQAILSRDAPRIFSRARNLFGRLPGFDFADDVLISPPGYATVTDGDPNDFLPD